MSGLLTRVVVCALLSNSLTRYKRECLQNMTSSASHPLPIDVAGFDSDI